jgi:hypothetical protein
MERVGGVIGWRAREENRASEVTGAICGGKLGERERETPLHGPAYRALGAAEYDETYA